jgi:hypothetical protein
MHHRTGHTVHAPSMTSKKFDLPVTFFLDAFEAEGHDAHDDLPFFVGQEVYFVDEVLERTGIKIVVTLEAPLPPMAVLEQS